MMGQREEAAGPAPLICVGGDTGSLTDRADADVAEEDLPAFVEGFLIAAAGEGGHGTGSPASHGDGKPLRVGGRTSNPPLRLLDQAGGGS